MGAPWPNDKAPHDGGEGQIYAWPPISQHSGPLPAVAVYDLAVKPTTYDFVVWAIVAKTLGAKVICFKYDGYIADWKYPPNVSWARFGNILVPASKFVGLPWFMNNYEQGFSVSTHPGWVNRLYKHLGQIELLKPSMELRQSVFKRLTGTQYVTITIRESIRNQYRDSNRPEWEKVKTELERRGTHVVLLEDSETSGFTMNVEQRMALYSGAMMNLGVSNGPMGLCHYGVAPYLTFKMVPKCKYGEELEKHMDRVGFVRGSQYLFRGPRQELVWEDDDYGTIMDAYDRVMN